MTLEELRKYKSQIEALASEYGLEDIRVFGSVAHGNATEKSDVDFVVRLSQPLGFKFFTFQHALEELLDNSVDVLTYEGINRHMKEKVLRDAVCL